MSIGDRLDNDVSAWRRAFLHLCFGESLSYYSDINDADISPALVSAMTQEIESQFAEMSVRQQSLAFLLLYQLDSAKAKELAQALLESVAEEGAQKGTEDAEEAEAATRDLALRISLMPAPSDGQNGRSSENMPTDATQAVKYFGSGTPQQIKLVMRFLALGRDALTDSEQFPDYSLRIYGSSHYYSSSSDGVKVRIPKPPIGLELDMLSRPLEKGDAETKAYATYFASLLDKEVDLDQLIDFSDEYSDSEEIAKLVYRAIATQNADNLVDVVEAIYERLNGESDYSLAADIYWTIRVMDGKQALALRKRIRKDVGMSTLKNY